MCLTDEILRLALHWSHSLLAGRGGGGLWRAAPLLAGSRMNRWVEGQKGGQQEETEKQATR